MINTVCVYCGSSKGNEAIYAEEAKAFGRLLVQYGLKLVYGGARVGIMGILADTVLKAGGTAIGVIPENLVDLEVAHDNLSELHVVDSMHKRKAEMADRSDAFIALPGGLGTFEELFEVMTWAQLGLHQKPCGLLNINGFFDPLVAFLDHAVDQGFIQSMHRRLLMVEEKSQRLIERFNKFKPVTIPKWIDEDER